MAPKKRTGAPGKKRKAGPGRLSRIKPLPKEAFPSNWPVDKSWPEIMGDDARVSRVVNPLGKGAHRKLIRRAPRTEFFNKFANKRYGHTHAIAHLLFPANFTEIVASEYRPNAPKYYRRTDVVFSKEKRLSRKSALGIRSLYKARWGRLSPAEAEAAEYQSRFAKSPRVWEKVRELRAWGLDPFAKDLSIDGSAPQAVAVNVGESSQGKPVFFEVVRVHFNLLKSRVDALRDSSKKRQLSSVLDALGQMIPGHQRDRWVIAHDYTDELFPR